MVTEWFFHALLVIPRALLQALSQFSLPSYLTGTGDGTLSGWLSSVVGSLSLMGNWMPGSQLTGAALLVLAAMLLAATVIVVRIVASFLTLGGGGT